MQATLPISTLSGCSTGKGRTTPEDRHDGYKNSDFSRFVKI